MGLWVFGSNLSYFSLVILTVDRYVYITRGLRYSALMTKGRTAAWIAVGWLMAVTWGFVSFILMGLGGSDHDGSAGDSWAGHWTVAR